MGQSSALGQHCQCAPSLSVLHVKDPCSSPCGSPSAANNESFQRIQVPDEFVCAEVVSIQAFVEQMLQGHRLTLSMDGVGLDVHVKLDRNCTSLELTFSTVLKRIFLKSVCAVETVQRINVRHLETLDQSPCAAWATRVKLDDDRICEFIFDVQREAEYFASCLKVLCHDARLLTSRVEDADLAAGLPTARSVAPDTDAARRDPEAFMDALCQALKENAEALSTEEPSQALNKSVSLHQQRHSIRAEIGAAGCCKNPLTMGASFSRKLPFQDFRVYFSDRLVLGWEEFLCCPEVAGCGIRRYSEDDPTGGPVEYTVMRSVSYSPYVPRFVMEVRNRHIPRPAIVGRLEKLDTIFRAKTGEFLCVHLWKLVVNGLQWSNAKKRSVISSEGDMLVQHVGIVTQAKIDFDHPTDVEWILRPESERWVQTISTDHPLLAVAPRNRGVHRSVTELSAIRMKMDGNLVGTAMQQKFVESDEDLRSYLGVQMDLQKLEERAAEGVEDEDMVKHSFTTEGLLMMLVCLAWSAVVEVLCHVDTENV
eukprot:symbB.v1.2.000894.t1/scaffold27.1/size414596/2